MLLFTLRLFFFYIDLIVSYGAIKFRYHVQIVGSMLNIG